jgi:hypothetical protein
MSYWGSGPIDSDYAFDAVGVYVLMIKDRMFQGAETVIQKAHPEQSIVASVQCLRLLAAQFPKCVMVHFGSKALQKAREEFGRWYELVQEKLPAKYREAVRTNAEAEFQLFEEQVLKAG